MGSNDGDDDEKPVRQVTLDGFLIMKTEVVNAMYKRSVDAGACTPAGNSRWNNGSICGPPWGGCELVSDPGLRRTG